MTKSRMLPILLAAVLSVSVNTATFSAAAYAAETDPEVSTEGNVSINGSAQKDGKTCVMQTLSGACYTPNEGGDGEFIGNFNGHRRDGKMRYSLSDIAPADAQKVADAIAEIEDIINKS